MNFAIFFLLIQPLSLLAQTYPPETPFTFVAMPSVAKPGYLSTIVDPSFGTNVTRIGDAATFSSTTRPYHSYAKDQPWNSNSTLIKLHPYINFEIIDAVTLQHVRTIPAVSGSNVWSNTNPNLMYGTSLTSNPSHPAHNTFYKEDATTGVITVMRTFSIYTEVSLGQNEGNLSNNDQYAVLQCKKSSGGNDLVVYDLLNDVVLSTLSIGNIWPNNCTMSQSGDYVVIEFASNGTTSTTGTCVYTKNLTFVRNVNNSSGSHFDVGYDTGGNEVVVQQATTDDRSVTMTRMNNGTITTILTTAQMSYPIHISCRNINRPGWAYFTEFQASGTRTTAPNYQQIFAVKLDGSTTVNSFAHVHHSTNTNYDNSPFGVPNRDGSIVMWRSDWGISNGEVDSYIAKMAQTAPDTLAPTIPTGLASSNITSSSFTLSWTASTDNVAVTGYDVYKDGTLYGSTTTLTTLNISGLSASTAYQMTVKAKDAAGNVSAASVALGVTTSSPSSDTQAPSIPTGLASSSITSASFLLSWSASTDNVGVTGYDVYKDGVLFGSTTTATSLSITGLAASTTYQMTVRAKDAAGNISGASTPLPVTTATGSSSNIALNKAVFVSSTIGSGYIASYAVDGNLSTSWKSNGTGVQWIYVDLGGNFNITSVVVKWGTPYGKSYKVQISNDGISWTDVFSTTTGSGGNVTINTTQTCRYVRVYATVCSAKNGGYNVKELEVYGTSASFAARMSPPMEDIEALKIAIYPNPVRNFLNISGNTFAGNAIIKIYNQAGQEVLNRNLTGMNGRVDVSKLTSGIYFLHIISGSKSVIKKISKE